MAKNKREKAKYPALRPELNLKTRYELIDYDYVNNLAEEDKKWLNKFTEEYVNASLNSKELDKNFHNTDKLKKDCYNRNNARNRDILTIIKATGNYISTEDLVFKENPSKEDIENDLLEEIDNTLCYLDEASTGTDDDGNDTDNF